MRSSLRRQLLSLLGALAMTGIGLLPHAATAGEQAAALRKPVASGQVAARGEIGAHEAMKRTGAEWETITERLDRADQIRQWQALRKRFGGHS